MGTVKGRWGWWRGVCPLTTVMFFGNPFNASCKWDLACNDGCYLLPAKGKFWNAKLCIL